SVGATMAARVAMIAIVTSNSISVKPGLVIPSEARDLQFEGATDLQIPRSLRFLGMTRSVLDDTQDLLDSREAGFHLGPAIHPERHEAGTCRDGSQFGSRGTRRERIAEVVGDHQH